MSKKYVFILLNVIFITLSQTISNKRGEDVDYIWDDDDDGEKTTTLAPQRILDNNTISVADNCECVLYYLCDRNRTKEKKMKPNYGDGVINVRTSQKCPHYLLKCCDDEDSDEPYFPETKLKPKGCGYRNPNFRTSLTDGFAEFGEFPWVTAILNNKEYICSGSLVHPQVVLTAAHCLKNIKNLKIRAGVYDSVNENKNYPYQEKEVESFITHEKFHPVDLINDIALLFLKKPVQLEEHIDLICLPPGNTVIDKKKCIANGWKRETFGKKGVLTKIELPLVSRDKCEDDFKRAGVTRIGSIFGLHESFFCAEGNISEAVGGIPLVCPIEGEPERYFQVGVDAWTHPCGECKYRRGFINVALFRAWIDEKIKERNFDTSLYTF